MEAGLVERRFGDWSRPSYRASEDEVAYSVAACWFFRLTEKGLAVRAILQREAGDGQN